MRHRVLVVDDDAEVRRVVERVLATQGCDVQSAVNGAQAFDVIERSGLPDVIILDLMMPVMGGWEFCHHREGIPALSRVPVILTSAQANLEHAPCCQVVRYLPKPFALSDLRSSVRSALDSAVHGPQLLH